MSRARRDYSGVVLAAPATVPYVRYSPETAHWWLARALRGSLAAAGLGPRDVDGLCVSSFSLEPDTAVGLVQHLGLSPRWLDHIPMGGASGVVALRRAARAVQAGDAEVVACIAGDTNHIHSFRLMLGAFSRFAQDASWPIGAGGPNASFAMIMDAYMGAYGITRADIGHVAVAQRANALRNPHAVMKTPLTLEQYLEARPIADPVHLFDCVMPCSGSEALLVMTEDRARSLGLPFARILGLIERHNAFPEDPVQLRGGWVMDRDELWNMAGIAHGDVDLVQTYDDYPFVSMMQIEDLGFCPKGEVASFLGARDLTVAGDFPHNTSGGQLSAGQAGAAGGYIGLVEAIRQVTGRAGPTQVEGARHACVTGYGMVNFDRGLCSGAAIIAGEAA